MRTHQITKCILICTLAAVMFIDSGCKSKSDNKDESGSEAGDGGEKLFTRIDPASCGISFVNSLTETDSFNIFVFEYIYNGGGVAITDINNDSLPDIFFTGNQSTCRLYLNEGKMKFREITESAGVKTMGWCTGVTVVDVNADGFKDFYVCRSDVTSPPERRTNLLFINNGDLTFTENAHAYGIDNSGYSTQSVFFDYDRDDDPDLFLVNHPAKNTEVINNKKVRNARYDSDMSCHLYRNNGDQTFTDVTQNAGVTSYAFGLSVSITDINNDQWPDIYVCNDYLMSDFLFINNKNGTFTDKLYSYFRHTSHFSMGSDFGDINNDGLMDFIQLDMLPEDNYRQKIMGGPENYDKYMLKVANGYGHQLMKNCLQLNTGNGSYSEIGEMAGISKTDWSWTPLIADFDNDGYNDIYITNGYLRDVTNMDYVMYRHTELREKHGVYNAGLKMLNIAPTIKLMNYMYHNDGRLHFTNVASEWGLKEQAYSNGASCADLDLDGDLDLVVNNINDTAFVYQNNSTKQNGNQSLTVTLKGNPKNKMGIGALVTLYDSSGVHVKENYLSRGYLSSTTEKLHFGLGKNNTVTRIRVRWPDESVEDRKITQPVTSVTFIQQEAGAVKLKSESVNPLFEDVSGTKGISFTHQENEYIDFKNEPLLPQKFSQNGPGIAVGDVNNDGEDDFYIGGAMNQSGRLFVMQPGGNYTVANIKAFEDDKAHEDMGAIFFDADNDGDQDLAVSSGGSEIYNLSAYYQARLYTNSGKGNFTRNNDALPPVGVSSSCITAADYDDDGDMDLFIGGRVVPGNYPLPAKSYLLRNDNGKFTDVTATIAPELEMTGLVCAALWTDFDNDNKIDLVVTGEWMPVSFFRNTDGKFQNVTSATGLSQSNGWWNSIAGDDLDSDGDMDYVLGNFGLNNKIKAAPSKPASVHAGDFDKNGSLDAILCYYYSDGISYPIYTRDDLTDQIRPLKKKLIRYADYAGKTLEQLFTQEELKDVRTLYSYTFSSSWVENNGNGTFSLHQLPIEAQTAPVFGMLTGDFNNDSYRDILLTGNSYAAEPELERFDAGNGLLLLGNGKGNFQPVKIMESGFYTPYDAKALVRIISEKQKRELVLVSNNNGGLQTFQSQKTSADYLLPMPTEWKAVFYFDNGKTLKVEFPYGSGYLSQSSRKIPVPEGTRYAELTGAKGSKRTVQFGKSAP